MVGRRGMPDIDQLQLDLQTLSDEYTLERLLGNGSYGDVACAKISSTGERVAAKRIRSDVLKTGFLAQRMYREVQVMQHLHWTVIGEHRAAHFVGLRDILVPETRHFTNFWMIMDLCDCDLRFVVGQGRRPGLPGIELQQVRYVVFQLLHALQTMKSARIVHRDIQAANVLLNCSTMDVKVCDFGLAREITTEEMNCNVTMQWYRAPELLLRSQYYDYQVDLWGAGCILGDLIALHGLGHSAREVSPIFKTQPVDNEESLTKMLVLLGPPAREDLIPLPASPRVCRYEPQSRAVSTVKKISKVTTFTPVDWFDHFDVKAVPEAALAIDLLEKMLHWNPHKRAVVEECLKHPWFTDLVSHYTSLEETHAGPVPPFRMRDDADRNDTSAWKSRIFDLAQKSKKRFKGARTTPSSSPVPLEVWASQGSISPGCVSLAVPNRGASPNRSFGFGTGITPAAPRQNTEQADDCDSAASALTLPPPSPCTRLLALIGTQLERGGEESAIAESAAEVCKTNSAVRAVLSDAGFTAEKGFHSQMHARSWQQLAVRIRRSQRDDAAPPPAWEAPQDVAPLKVPSNRERVEIRQTPARKPEKPVPKGCCGEGCVAS
eukprot:TRINITY_DN6179_c0_g1_i1.p1 TRINITY_DN6179_c0_g1~~TRINITY_DN6179_c0_g1_i1.p1  ORF type:complete len:605 (+),score=87.83 TRINITY_DN6179_c0_g1_i1:117-1931(+)